MVPIREVDVIMLLKLDGLSWLLADSARCLFMVESGTLSEAEARVWRKRESNSQFVNDLKEILIYKRFLIIKMIIYLSFLTIFLLLWLGPLRILLLAIHHNSTIY